VDEIEYNRFLGLVYDAAVDPDLWPRALARLSELTGASGAVMIRQNEETGEGQGIRANVDPTAAGLYYGYFATRNVLLDSTNARQTLRRWTPCIMTDEHKLPKRDLMRTEYYNDFMRRFGIHSLLLVRLALFGMDTVVINLIRPTNRDQFDRAELALTGRLHPHLIRAFDVGQKLASARIDGDDMAATLDHSPYGLFLVDEAGRLRHANRPGRALLDEPDGLRVSGGKLSAATPAATQRLRALIGQAAAAHASRRTGGSMALPTPSRRLPLSLTVAPTRPERWSLLGAAPCSVLVCVTDLEAGVSLPEQKLRDLFALTPAETRLAVALFEGLSPTEAAASFGVSPHTVRIQLARIFSKTGTNRQAALARLMMRLVGANIAP
jgi:DNA-binding CsgD family transcriptional regulator/PAS domain-containing protein